MAVEDVPDYMHRLVQTMDAKLRRSEMDIAIALAEARGPLSIDELAEETGYTTRTIKKRVGTLSDRLHGEPLIRQDEDGDAILHTQLASAIRQSIESEDREE